MYRINLNYKQLRFFLMFFFSLVLVSCEPPASNAEQQTDDSTSSLFVAAAKGRVDIEGGLVKLAGKRDGVVRSILVEEGSHVKAGQALLILDDEQAKLSAELTKAELEHVQSAIPLLEVKLAAADREVRRLSPLASTKIVEHRELDLATDQSKQLKYEIKSAQTAVVTAQKRLKVSEFEIEQRIVRAPADGRIVKRTARPGDGVSTLNVTPLFLFAPDAPKIIRAELEERFLGNIKLRQSAEVIIEANDSQRFPAVLQRIGLVVGQRTPSEDASERQDNRVVECVLSIDAPELLIGQRVIVRFKKE